MPRATDILPEVTPSMSPMMRQYVEIKSKHMDSILFFRLGDFYEMFYNDAVVASDELDLVLTKRANGEEEKAPMCGVPYHSCESYIARLVKKGYRVAICEQTEDPAKAKKLVKRDVTRIITPGTVTEDSMLDVGRNNYLATVCYNKFSCGLCFIDISTGEVHLTELSSEQIAADASNELMRFMPSEVLLNNDAAELSGIVTMLSNKLGARVEIVGDEDYCSTQSKINTLDHFKAPMFSSLGIVDDSVSCKALCCAMDFLMRTQKNDLSAITEIDIYSDNQFMRLDISTRTNLELVETMRGGSKKGSLLWVLDHTRTPMGKRLIRSWIEQPLLSPAKISKRQNAVAELVTKFQLREELTEALRDIKDIERLMTRVLYGTANPKELLSLSDTLQKMPRIKTALDAVNSSMLREIYENIEPNMELSLLIKSAIREDAPMLVREGGIIRDGYNEEVDRLRADKDGGTTIVSELEAREAERTGVKKLRIRYNRVFGYYIEIPNSADFEPPEDYIRRQTLANCERYVTTEVKELEARILGAQDKLVALEYELFCALRSRVGEYADSIKRTASAIAQLDAVWSLALTAAENNYVCPEICVDGRLEIIEGRHPVVEQISNAAFVPNDTMLDCGENRCSIITGPNMAGKSTYMRQTAVITLMAQIGSFVPARSARISIVDAIFTRVGASDDLAGGQSTFMVEMSEVANILKYATKNSLLIIDEIGRGTSTYDGMAIARAVLEYVADRKKIGAKTLFATHYHELTALEGVIDGVKNYNIAAKKRGDDIIFLRRIVRGGADESYGIEVAKLAGVPGEVIKRAKRILHTLEDTYKSEEPITEIADDIPEQVTFTSNQTTDITKELQLIDVNTLTPIEALQKLYELCDKAKKI